MDTNRQGTIRAELRPDPAFLEEGTAEFGGLPGRFCMFFQPDLDLITGVPGACEALLRWWHPDFGMLRPDTSLHGTRWEDEIEAIEEWAITAVCEQAAEWSTQGLGIRVALNVSRGLLRTEQFALSLDRALVATGVDPRYLAIDLPVAAFATDRQAVIGVTGAVAERGVTVVLDGVGIATSLMDLEAITSDEWKIDLCGGTRGRAELHASVVDAIERARKLGVATVAKAVEDDATLRAARDLGFDRAFGHAISPALNPSAMSALLRRPQPLPLPLPLATARSHQRH